MPTIDRTIFFNFVRQKPFNGTLTQQQVDGMSGILTAWERDYDEWDLRWLAYCLATTMHETGSAMWPVEEYGKGEGMSYGEPDPTTGQIYYGRGYVQLTWAENYQRADKELELEGTLSCYWHPENQLIPEIAASTMFRGMSEGWFRTLNGVKQTLSVYFNETRNDPFGAREIINGDKSKIPSWSNGVSIGNLIKGYHENFLVALESAYLPDDSLPPAPDPGAATVVLRITKPPGVMVQVIYDEEDMA